MAGMVTPLLIRVLVRSIFGHKKTVSIGFMTIPHYSETVEVKVFPTCSTLIGAQTPPCPFARTIS